MKFYLQFNISDYKGVITLASLFFANVPNAIWLLLSSVENIAAHSPFPYLVDHSQATDEQAWLSLLRCEDLLTGVVNRLASVALLQWGHSVRLALLASLAAEPPEADPIDDADGAPKDMDGAAGPMGEQPI